MRADGSGATDEARALGLVPVSRETRDRLAILVDRLLHWQRVKNLVGPGTLTAVWTRHIADSAQLLGLVPMARRWVDLGSGAGFPGLVVACQLADEDGAVVHLIESNARKAAFLREAARALAVPAVIHNRRIEDTLSQWTDPVDVVSARALASLPKLLALAAPLLDRGAVGIFPKGTELARELTDSAAFGTVNLRLVDSRTEPSARIVLAERVRG